MEYEQQGRYRAAYGKETLVHLSASLTAEFGRGFSRANLEYMRKFYVLWQDRAVQISQKPSEKLPVARIRQTASGKSPAAIAKKPCAIVIAAAVTLHSQWVHYVLLLTIKKSRRPPISAPPNTSSICLPKKT